MTTTQKGGVPTSRRATRLSTQNANKPIPKTTTTVLPISKKIVPKKVSQSRQQQTKQKPIEDRIAEKKKTN